MPNEYFSFVATTKQLGTRTSEQLSESGMLVFYAVSKTITLGLRDITKNVNHLLKVSEINMQIGPSSRMIKILCKNVKYQQILNPLGWVIRYFKRKNWDLIPVYLKERMKFSSTPFLREGPYWITETNNINRKKFSIFFIGGKLWV